MGARAALVAVVSAVGLLAGAGSALAETMTFSYTGKEQEFKVPAGVTSVKVVAVGGAGGIGGSVEGTAGAGGLGAVASGNLGVTPGQTLYVEVGGSGESGQEPSKGTGGFNGGGSGSQNFGVEDLGGGGGGASDVRTESRTEAKTLESRLLIAAGGGGGGEAGCRTAAPAGAGGNAEEAGHTGIGCAAFGEGGGAGSSTKPGAGGGNSGLLGFPTGVEGALGAGGGKRGGGGGGGGLYGGGSGGAGLAGGGGGGGSNLVPAGGEAKVAKAGEATAVTITTIPPVVLPTTPPVIPPVITPPPPPPQVPPVLSGLTAVHRCVIRVGLGRPHVGSGGLPAFSFTLSETANVTFAVLHRVGSPAWRKCPPVRGRTPGTYRSVGEVGALVPAGQQTVYLGGAARARRSATVIRLAPGRHRISLAQIAQTRLPPGTYVVSAKAVNSAGQASGVDYAKFWVSS
jgi:hypothetical protein